MDRSPELALKWLNYAMADLAIATNCLPKGSVYIPISAFNAHQAAEKAIKGYLINEGLQFKRTHDLNELVTMAEDKKSFDPKLFFHIAAFQDFTVDVRYPDYGIDLTEKDARLLLNAAHEIVEIVKSKLK